MRKVITVVQARMGSSRLPGKVMMRVQNKTLLELQLERISMALNCGKIVVATSTNQLDDELVSYVEKLGYEVFRGNKSNLLDRHYRCAIKYKADIVAKIPSDCPLIDREAIEAVFDLFYKGDFDYVSNLHPATYPDGNDCEVFSFQALEKACIEATKSMEREHTTPYFWEHPESFRLGNVIWNVDKDYSMSHRFTLDYLEDYYFIEAVYNELYPKNPRFNLNDILNLLERNPRIYDINSKYAGVNWYRNHLDELKTIDSGQTRKL